MKSISYVPTCNDFSFDGMLHWFAAMSQKDLLFHPDDDPATIAYSESGKPVFSRRDVAVLRLMLATFFKLHGDDVYEAAYPVFMQRFGNRLDADG